MEAPKKQKDKGVQREVEVQKEALLKMQTESEGDHIQEEEEEEEGKSTQVLHVTYVCEFIIFGGCLASKADRPSSLSTRVLSVRRVSRMLIYSAQLSVKLQE